MTRYEIDRIMNKFDAEASKFTESDNIIPKKKFIADVEIVEGTYVPYLCKFMLVNPVNKTYIWINTRKEYSVIPYFALNKEFLESLKDVTEEHLVKSKMYHNRYDIYWEGANVTLPKSVFREIFFRRVPGNDNIKTFDYIEGYITLPSPVTMDNVTLRRKVEEEAKSMLTRVVKRLSEDSRFTRYGVPVNMLKVTQLAITADRRLFIQFGLKELKGR